MSVFPYNPGPPAQAWHRSHTNHPSRKCSTAVTTGQSDRGNFSTEVSSSQVTLVHVNLTKPNQHIFLFLKSKWPMFYYFYIYLCMCIHAYGVALSQRSTCRNWFTSTGRVPESEGDQTQVIKLGGKRFHRLRHLGSPMSLILFPTSHS